MKALVVGGNSGVGLALVLKLIERGYDHVYVVGKDLPKENDFGKNADKIKEKTTFIKTNLINGEFDLFDQFIDEVNTLILTVGFGRVAPFSDLTEIEVQNLLKCNLTANAIILKKFYKKLACSEDFYCAVMGSIAGHVASPMFSVYGASKFGLCSLIENINTELACEGYKNRVLDVSPGSLKGTNFNGQGNDLSLLDEVCEQILDKTFERETLFIPQFDVYGKVLERYKKDPKEFAKSSYEYKVKSGRTSKKPQVTIGYLSGTFDLFHVGHLNLLRRAKEQCDYLIVGVHKSGAWKGKETYIPFEERKAIVESIKYVDKAIESFPEDADAYAVYKYDKLFVGSDYKGTERFLRYEEYFKDKGVEIVYFPYTKGTSSTQLRLAISSKKEDK